MTQSIAKPLGITDTILRDSHQSLLATRMRIEDMIPAMEMLDEVGYWSLEVWGGATFDACMRFLDEDPWERLRIMKKRMPKTDVADLEGSFAEVSKLTPRMPSFSEDAFKSAQKLMLVGGMIKEDEQVKDFSSMYTNKFVK